MLDKRQKLINECIGALTRINHEHGYHTISRQTLNVIVQGFIEKNGDVAVPNIKQGSSPAIVPVADHGDIISMFDRKSDLKSVQQTNKENADRLKREREEANKKVLRAYRIKRENP